MDDIKIEAFKSELITAREEINSLKENYETQIGELKEEVSFLKEKLTSQQEMLNMAVTYSNKLGKELRVLQKRVDSGNFQSIH